MSNWKRTHYCGEINTSLVDQEVVVMGWVNRQRDHGGVIFIDLRDRTGIVQVVIDQKSDPKTFFQAEKVRNEFVLTLRGKVYLRPEGTANPELTTGEVEIRATDLQVLNTSETPPFDLTASIKEISENVRLRYRYLDLRRSKLQQNLILRHQVMKVVRDYLSNQGFIEVETPFLTKSTPEGARDYLVPSRVNFGCFYALPQSPQLFKQLLMVAGFDRYYQIVRCFRDEDLRADRQPEFTQIDLEMSFIQEEDIFSVVEGMLAKIFSEVSGITLNLPFPRLPYEEAMKKYGVDKPDLRFALICDEITDIVRQCNFKVFSQAIIRGGKVKGIKVPQGANFSRKQLDDLTEVVKVYGAQGLAWFKVTTESWESPIAKFFSEQEQKEI
ncbi:MAG: aspartate--tRNA ligase [Desulfobacterota bacterium]|nr:aspartate--tRNA ligase [Thermodesulfobacteriota bacterium]